MIPEARLKMSPNVSLREKAIEGVSPQMGRALGVLLAGRGPTAAAEAAGVNRRTVTRWMSDDPQFIAIYNSLRLEMIESVRQSLVILAPRAVKEIRSLMTKRSTPPGIRLRAAIAILDQLRTLEAAGPTEIEDAETAIAFREKRRKMDALMARVGMDREELLESLDHDDLDDEDLDGEGEDDGPAPSNIADVLRLAIQKEIDAREAARGGDQQET